MINNYNSSLVVILKERFFNYISIENLKALQMNNEMNHSSLSI